MFTRFELCHTQLLFLDLGDHKIHLSPTLGNLLLIPLGVFFSEYTGFEFVSSDKSLYGFLSKLIYSFSKHLVNTHYGPGSLLHIRVKALRTTVSAPVQLTFMVENSYIVLLLARPHYVCPFATSFLTSPLFSKNKWVVLKRKSLCWWCLVLEEAASVLLFTYYWLRRI